MAEGLIRHALTNQENLHVHSAGVAAENGEPANPNTLSILQDAGIDLSSHLSRPLTVEMIKEATVVLTMTSTHLECIIGMFQPAKDKTYLLGDFSDDPSFREIPDPIGGSLETYRETRDAILTAIPHLVNFINQLDQAD